jgi:thiol-disulfide isomerase/thioredoxin
MTKITAVVFFCLALTVNVFSQDLKPVSNADELKMIFDSSKGKVMLLNFWATWCKPCVKEFPELVKLYANYKEKGFELVFISLDDLSEVDTKLKPFLVKYGVDFTTYYNKFTKPEELIDIIDKNWSGAIPSTYIYDKEGALKSSILGNKTYEQFEKEIIPLLN